MQGENRNNIVESKKVSLPLYLRRFWDDQQRKYGLEGMATILFDTQNESNQYWRFHIDPSLSFTLNEQLEKIFSNPEMTNATLRNSLKNSYLPKGFFIPKNEIQHLGKELLSEHLIVAYKFFSGFNFSKVLEAIKSDLTLIKQPEFPIPIIGTWHFFVEYIGFLKHIKAIDLHAVKAIRKVKISQIVLSKFNQLLPSEQLTQILFEVLHLFFNQKYNEKHIEKFIAKSAPEVQTFWKNWKAEIQKYLNHFFIQNSLKNQKNIFESNSIRQDFYKIHFADFDLIRIQEILDNSSTHNYLERLPKSIQEKYNSHEDLSFGQRMKKAIGNASILDRIESLKDKNEQLPHPHFFAKNKNWLEEEEAYYWYQLKEKERIDILDAIETSMVTIHQKQLDAVVKQRWNLFMENLSNNIIAPFIFWEKGPSNWYPQFNLLEYGLSKELDKTYQEKRKKEQAEFARLQKILEELYTKRSPFAVNEFSQSVGEFKFAIVQEKWQKSYSEHLLKLKTLANYRIQKMREFGILEGKEVPNFRKEIWLDELLTIEEEVRPFISFVKRAFQGALPVRKTVEFHPYRHSMDGVEFDPETIQDHEKWMHGEVMKSLRVKIDKQPIEQINAFALDFSGSMKHEKMRNLFKLCYLLILGLEDRKTYDAFHLFSTNFIETANFTHRYTNRTLLFKILVNVARIRNSKVEYKGTGGTNISEGIFECHKRIKDFSKNLKKRNPNLQHLTSIFVITDGEPSAGIINVEKLREAIDEKRKESNIAIKGIYLKPEGEEIMFMEDVFGKDNFVETENFNDALEQFVYIMALTYKKQRKELKKMKKLEKLNKKK